MIRPLLSFLSISLSLLCLAQNYSSIEATEYDAEYDRWLTGNGNRIIAQNADGDLSYFGTGGANYGMEVMNGHLFAIHNSSVKVYQLSDGTLVNDQAISGAGFLNGMGSDPQSNRIWLSDFSNSRIIEIDFSDIESPDIEVVVSNTGSTPNGVVYDHIDNRVLFATWGGGASIRAVDLSDYSVSTVFNAGVGNIDGLDMTADGRFMFSCWSPQRVRLYNHDFSEMLQEWTGFSNPADLSWAEEINTIGVANSANNTLSLLEVEANSLDELSAHTGMSLFPNPVETVSKVDFVLEESTFLELVLRDIRGLEVKQLYRGQKTAGNHNIHIDAADVETGLYLLELRANSHVQAIPLVVSH